MNTTEPIFQDAIDDMPNHMDEAMRFAAIRESLAPMNTIYIPENNPYEEIKHGNQYPRLYRSETSAFEPVRPQHTQTHKQSMPREKILMCITSVFTFMAVSTIAIFGLMLPKQNCVEYQCTKAITEDCDLRPILQYSEVAGSTFKCAISANDHCPIESCSSQFSGMLNVMMWLSLSVLIVQCTSSFIVFVYQKNNR